MQENDTDFIENSSLHGLKENEFAILDELTKEKLVRMIARIMERAYRRGVHQALSLKKKEKIKVFDGHDAFSYRYDNPLSLSVGLDGNTSYSITRLYIEEKLDEVGFPWFINKDLSV